MNKVSTICFVFAVIHTLLTNKIQTIGNKYSEGSFLENLFHFLGEIEIVFGLWALIWIVISIVSHGTETTVNYLKTLSYAEPSFVFSVLLVASTKPILEFAKQIILAFSHIIPIQKKLSFYFSLLVAGPLLGSIITEPAAMALTALILRETYFFQSSSDRFKYFTLAFLFVNISVGGVLTPYAAPPVVMVAAKWGWNLHSMFFNFGLKSILVVIINSALATLLLKNEINKSAHLEGAKFKLHVPLWMIFVHSCVLIGVVYFAHEPILFLLITGIFLGIHQVTKEFQNKLYLKQSALVFVFLSGLVILGGNQKWWLQIFLEKTNEFQLFLGSVILTTIIDNAALTYLATVVGGFSDVAKYMLVSGAVVGGGMTIIANAPNPAGFAILKDRFKGEGLDSIRLFQIALLPTLIAFCVFYLLA